MNGSSKNMKNFPLSLKMYHYLKHFPPQFGVKKINKNSPSTVEARNPKIIFLQICINCPTR